MSKDKSNKTERRSRNYATVVYPDSAPDDWREILSSQLVPAFVSPLHDRDMNPGGEMKKPHYHVIIMYEGAKTREQAIELFGKISGVGCEVVQSIRGYARYLCHLDNPEKAQYSPDDVCVFCGADYIGTIGLAIDRYKALREMTAYCRQNEIYSYADFFDFCADNRSDWFRVLCDSGTLVMKEYLSSRYWTLTHLLDDQPV